MVGGRDPKAGSVGDRLHHLARDRIEVDLQLVAVGGDQLGLLAAILNAQVILRVTKGSGVTIATVRVRTGIMVSSWGEGVMGPVRRGPARARRVVAGDNASRAIKGA